MYQISWLATFGYLTLKFDEVQIQGSFCFDIASPDPFLLST